MTEKKKGITLKPETPADESPPAKKKAGRPKGSKNYPVQARKRGYKRIRKSPVEVMKERGELKKQHNVQLPERIVERLADNGFIEPGVITSLLDRYMEVCRRVDYDIFDDFEWDFLYRSSPEHYHDPAELIQYWPNAMAEIILEDNEYNDDNIREPYEFIERLQSLDFVQLVAVIDRIERFWQKFRS